MLEPSPRAGTAYIANAPTDPSVTAATQPSATFAAVARHDDYAWTHSAAVEGFFVVLTVVVVPVALVRWTRRLRSLSHFGARRRAGSAPEEV